MNIENELQVFIREELLRGQAKNQIVEVGEPLISSGRVDSLGLIKILTFIEQRYGVDLMLVGTPSDFDTIAGLAAAVRGAKPGV